ncbi:hypothetical protein P5G50_18525 [Leifsonia sp. F6_8S_P_1B]|uniref:Uncharacterized protein n=1 Tax=Leifsonia williamsii TaxID=3035919 RepID=A0ABT8KG62_9MICO|nr:hypothetical protein [Leifsonia williamsii]MDN4616448.1 hypothetical protein [Leifsonia williamsii]
MSQWTPIENLRTVGRDSEYELAIREWKPGDGLTCTHASKQQKHPCGAPVAVFRTIWEEQTSYRPRTQVKKRVLCSRHVGEVLRQYVGEETRRFNSQPLIVRIEKEAAEKVLAAHWDEYQEALTRFAAEHEAALVASVPEGLRKFLVAEEAVS